MLTNKSESVVENSSKLLDNYLNISHLIISQKWFDKSI